LSRLSILAAESDLKLHFSRLAFQPRKHILGECEM
jgi:hypothetical protein